MEAKENICWFSRVARGGLITLRLCLAHFTQFIDDSSPVVTPEGARREHSEWVDRLRSERRGLFVRG